MYYKSSKITQRITMIESPSYENLFLIEGDEKAILIDAGLGVGNLRAFVEQLTEKPLMVLLSHGHIDHAPGATDFKIVYMNAADLPLYRSQCQLAERKGYLQANLQERYETLVQNTLLEENPDYPFLDLTDQMRFDLGGVHVKTVDFPGHTPGMMVFLVEEERILILGDACNNATYLFGPEAASVSAYRETVCKIRENLDGWYDRVFISHHDAEMPEELLDEMLEVCDDILAGRADDVPYHFRGMTGYIAKKCTKHFERLDGKHANLIYNKEKL